MSGESDTKVPQPAPTPPSQRRLVEAVDATPTKPTRGRKPKNTLAAPPQPAADAPTAPIPAALQAAADAHQYKMGLVGGFRVADKPEADIKAWADRKALEMLPVALAEVNFNLKYGNDKQRSEATNQVLDMHGLRKREAAAGQHATIVLNLNGGKDALASALPWLKREDKKDE